MDKVNTQVNKRYEVIDLIRTSAIVLMIIFHASFDLTLMGLANFDFSNDLFWWLFPRLIVFLFLFSMGLALEMTHKKKIRLAHVSKRFFKLSLCAVAISGFTYFAFPQRWIYFGTLHCIALSSLLAIPFLGRPILSLISAAIILVPLLWGFKWPWFQMSHASMDYIPTLPWFGVVLMGMVTIKTKLHTLNVPEFPTKNALLFMGRHSLIIYLIHQPILYGLTKIIHIASKSMS